MLHTSGCFTHCSSISANWSTTMSQNSRALCFRCTIIGESLTSTGVGTESIGPERDRIEMVLSCQGQSMRLVEPASFRGQGESEVPHYPAPAQHRWRSA